MNTRYLAIFRFLAADQINQEPEAFLCFRLFSFLSNISEVKGRFRSRVYFFLHESGIKP